MNIADRIQNLRKSRGISQEELADIIGVSRQAVSKWESEQSIPDIEKVILLSNYFETTTDYLLKGIEPVKEEGGKQSAMLFSIIGTCINVIGLITAISLWIERQAAYTVGIGLVIMAIGTLVFLIGQTIGNSVKKKKAKKSFILINVWILLFIPLSCLFNILSGLLEGFLGMIAPVPMLGNSLITFSLYWVLYIGVCIFADIIVTKRMEE